jgi:outer membrane protein assembly factor BamA
VRLVALGCVVLAGLLAQSGRAHAQPTPNVPAPDPNAPAPTPDPNAPPPDPNTPVPDPNAPPPPVDPAPPTPPAPTPPAPPPTKQSETEKRLAATTLCNEHKDCDWLATLSSLERASLRRALKAANRELDPSPWGKTIARVQAYGEDVFAEKNWLRFFNHFHVTTKPDYVEAELTIGAGEEWDDDRIQESQRRVKDPLYHSVVVLVPVKSTEPGKIDLFVVTRDIWSLRLNSKYAVQDCESVWYNPLNGCSLTDLQISLSENNFLGRRKTVAVGFVMDQGAISAGPLYIDKNWLLTDHHFDLRASFNRIFTRRSLDIVTEAGDRIPTGDPKGLQDGGGLRAEGTAASVTLSKPLWALASKWAVGGGLSYRNAVTRQYLSTGLRAYDDPDTTDPEALPRQYRMRTWSVRASGTRQWGKKLKHQIETGYSVSNQRPSLLSSFNFDPVLEDHFIRDVFPRSEFVSAPFIEYTMFEARFKMVRNVDTFELAEDVRFGWGASVGLIQTFKSLGSTFRFTRPSATVSYAIPWGRDGFARVAAGGQIRAQSGDAIDNTATASIRATTPTFGFLRIIGQAGFETRWDDRQNAFYTLGSDNGLRGYRINQQFGDRRFLAQVEARSVPFPFWVLRFGGVVFYDAGSAAASFNQMRMLHEVGVGMRMLVPQTSRELFRFDLALPLVDAVGTPAFRPRFIAGFDSYF